MKWIEASNEWSVTEGSLKTLESADDE